MMKILLALLPILLASCFLFKDYKKTEFVYNRNGQSATMPLIVPKGYVKQETTDTAGISLQTYYYPGGAMLYTAYLADTTYELQPFNKAIHQPLFHRLGGLVYKGQAENELFFREIRQGNYRFGYRDVPSINERYFDSATNYASLQKR
ncbi:MAG: hypothetical protein EOO10_11195 [Chitinophagaceae bacterium]|nr:MAG: hypothetical protein EOO10_11195 [Chitinophagaceae bacterium]